MAGCDRVRIILIIGVILIVMWVYMFVSLFQDKAVSPQGLSKPIRVHSIVDPSLRELDTEDPDNSIKELEQVNSKNLIENEFLTENVVQQSEISQSDRQRILNMIDQRLSLPVISDTSRPDVPPPPLQEIEQNMTRYLHTLHKRLGDLAGPKVEALDVWETFLEVTKSMPMTWDEQNRYRFPKPRKDNSIFVSLGTYRDPYCPMTIKSLYANANHPERLFVGLFQQNCFGPVCRTGVLAGGRVENSGADPDCYKEFCTSKEGIASGACTNGHVRLFNVNESESLGPYMARYLGAKFYRGEQYYLQIDSHSEFVPGWDDKLIKMVVDSEAEKPVISTYPPDSTQNWKNSIGFRMCDSEFAAAQIEWQIIRLGSSLAFDHKIPDKPKYAPFVAAGFFFSYADFLYDVPFDPFLPWIFMGEEISMSARLWTSGYDIFSPTVNVLNHYYVRRHYPKFWESVNR